MIPTSRDYKLEILFKPQLLDDDNPNSPKMFFWCILEYITFFNLCTWVNVGDGWANTVEDAYKEAIEYYNNILPKD